MRRSRDGPIDSSKPPGFCDPSEKHGDGGLALGVAAIP
jgi:hypothetical protein